MFEYSWRKRIWIDSFALLLMFLLQEPNEK